MAQFQIEYGIGGGYNVIHKEVIEADNLNEAELIAYESAVEVFESYGVFEKHNTVEDFEDDDDREIVYYQEIERWCRYAASLI